MSYCEVTGQLNDLIQLLSVSRAAVHLWLDLDNSTVLNFKQINDEKRPLATNRINIYAFFGTKEQGKAAFL